MILDFDRWFDEVLSHYHWQISTEERTKRVEQTKTSFRVEKEDPCQHKRKVMPGDWKEKMSDQARDYFKKEFGDLLIRLSYERDHNW